MAFNDIWGKEGLFAQGLRAKTRGRDAIAAAAERVNERQAVPDSIIGGQFVAGGDYANLNPALTGLRNREAYAQAVQQGNFGSSQLNAAALAPNRVQTGLPAPNTPTEAVESGAEAGNGGSPPPPPPPPPAQLVTPQSSNPVPNIADTESTVKTRTSDSLKRTTLGETGSLYDEGYQDGGMVEKPRRVKQPGMRGFSKVTLPLGYKWGAMDPNEPPMSEPMPEPKRPPGYKWGMSEDEMGYCNSGRARKGMRGYAMGGQIGDEMEDDGKDTVDVRVREGEYLLNPDTVAAFGGGDYEAGVRTLDGIAMAATGEEPGPVPVNEEGEAMEGYARGGEARARAARLERELGLDPTRRRTLSPEAQENLRNPTGTTTNKMGIQGTENTGRARGVRNVVGRVSDFYKSDVNKKPIRTAIKALRNNRVLGAGLRGAGTVGLAATALGAGREAGKGIYDEGVASGADWTDVVGGTMNTVMRNNPWLANLVGREPVSQETEDAYELAKRQLAAPDIIQPQRRDGLADITTQGQRIDARQTLATPATAGAYYRPFTNAPVSLRNPDTTYSAAQPVPQGQQRVVQRTGGPGNEVIVREDVNGVPTFSNLRDRSFDVGASNLQAQADRRYAEDTAARQQLLKNIARERELFDAATAPGALDRQAESEAALAKAIGKNDSSLEGMREAYTSLGLFTNPETGKIDDVQYNLFVDRVGAELAKEGININALPPQAMMVLASEYSMARPTSNQFNRIVEGETGVNPNAVLTPQDVPAARPAEFWRDLGWGNAGSNVGFWHALRGKPVYDVNIPGTRGEKMVVTPDDLGFRDLRRKNYYEGR